MDKMKVGIYSDFFSNSGGGIDFLATIAYALESSGKAKTYLIIKKDSFLLSFFKLGLYFLEVLFGNYKPLKSYVRNENYRNLIKGFEMQSPTTEILYFKRTRFNEEKKLEKFLQLQDIDILFPVGKQPLSDKFSLPWIGYIADFQHKYLTNFFSKEEMQMRDSSFENMLSHSRYVLVNANSVYLDINKFYPETKTDIIVLPFKPWLKPSFMATDLSAYSLPETYCIVSNQFWQHKSHITVFEAIEELFKKGITHLHVVCTGKLEDYRNPEFIHDLMLRISTFRCKNNIHLLGYIPKDDQLKIMNGAIALIQPSLFEGGPSAGGVIYALGMGLQCFVSDIDTNKEILGYENVYFFEKENAHSLAMLLETHIDDKKISAEIVNARLKKNLSEYSEYIVKQLERCVNEW